MLVTLSTRPYQWIFFILSGAIIGSLVCRTSAQNDVKKNWGNSVYMKSHGLSPDDSGEETVQIGYDVMTAYGFVVGALVGSIVSFDVSKVYSHNHQHQQKSID